MNSLFRTGRLVALAICALSSATIAQELPQLVTDRTITEVLPPHLGPLPDWNGKLGPNQDLGSVEGGAVTPGTLDRLHAGILRHDLKINGAQSCAAASCHGGPRPGVSQPHVRRGSEYQLWFENDPHARSWQTLCSDESLRMLQRLKIIESGQIVDRSAYDNCLACHNSTSRFASPADIISSTREIPSHRHAQTLNSFIREGVGCASCHGPDERWRGYPLSIRLVGVGRDE